MFNPIRGSSALHLQHLEVLLAWGVASAAFALLAFRWEPGVRGPRRPRSQQRAAFALSRVRELFEQADARTPRTQTEGHRPNEGPDEARAPAEHARVEPGLVEVIEGPAPSEDSSLPIEGANPGATTPPSR